MQKDKIIINPDFENWVNNNRELLRKYKGNWVAFTEEEGLVASKKTLHETQEDARKITSYRTVFYFVNPYIGAEGVAKEFSKSIQKNRHNYFPQVQHFFNLYFSKNVPEYPFN